MLNTIESYNGTKFEQPTTKIDFQNKKNVKVQNRVIMHIFNEVER